MHTHTQQQKVIVRHLTYKQEFNAGPQYKLLNQLTYLLLLQTNHKTVSNQSLITILIILAVNFDLDPRSRQQASSIK